MHSQAKPLLMFSRKNLRCDHTPIEITDRQRVWELIYRYVIFFFVPVPSVPLLHFPSPLFLCPIISPCLFSFFWLLSINFLYFYSSFLFPYSQVAPGVFVCGDHRGTATLNGALKSGRKAANSVLAEMQTCMIKQPSDFRFFVYYCNYTFHVKYFFSFSLCFLTMNRIRFESI